MWHDWFFTGRWKILIWRVDIKPFGGKSCLIKLGLFVRGRLQNIPDRTQHDADMWSALKSEQTDRAREANVIRVIGNREQRSTLQEQDLSPQFQPRFLKMGFMNRMEISRGTPCVSFPCLFVSLLHVENLPTEHCRFVTNFRLKTAYHWPRLDSNSWPSEPRPESIALSQSLPPQQTNLRFLKSLT
jgi:hypothetical protein